MRSHVNSFPVVKEWYATELKDSGFNLSFAVYLRVSKTLWSREYDFPQPQRKELCGKVIPRHGNLKLIFKGFTRVACVVILQPVVFG